MLHAEIAGSLLDGLHSVVHTFLRSLNRTGTLSLSAARHCKGQHIKDSKRHSMLLLPVQGSTKKYVSMSCNTLTAL